MRWRVFFFMVFLAGSAFLLTFPKPVHADTVCFQDSTCSVTCVVTDGFGTRIKRINVC